MIEKISDPVQGDGCLAASCSSLDHHDPVRSVSDNGILLFLNGADNVFQLYISVTSKLCLQDLIIDLHITFKLIDHFSTTDLILPLGSNVSMDFPQRCLIECRPFVSHRSVEGHRFPPQGLQFRYKRSQAHRRPHNRNPLFQKMENPSFSGTCGAARSSHCLH